MDKNIGIIYLRVISEVIKIRMYGKTKRQRKEHEKNWHLIAEQHKRNHNADKHNVQKVKEGEEENSMF